MCFGMYLTDLVPSDALEFIDLYLSIAKERAFCWL